MFSNNELKEVDGYKARLFKFEEYSEQIDAWKSRTMNESTMSINNQVAMKVLYPSGMNWDRIYAYYYGRPNAVRPVINVYKSAIYTNVNND